MHVKWESELLANTSLPGARELSVVAALPDGRFIVTWTGPGATCDDTDSLAARARVSAADSTPDRQRLLIA